MTNPSDETVLYDRDVISEELTDKKYVVFKRDEWEAACQKIEAKAVDIGTASGNVFRRAINELEPVADGVVIRRQDLMAPPVFDQYSNSYSAMAKVLAEHGEEATATRLMRVANYFHEQATLSWELDRKLPD